MLGSRPDSAAGGMESGQRNPNQAAAPKPSHAATTPPAKPNLEPDSEADDDLPF